MRNSYPNLYFYGILFLLFPAVSLAQLADTIYWKGSLLRKDGRSIDFMMQVVRHQQHKVYTIVNGDERITLSEVKHIGDSLVLTLPFYNSELRIVESDDQLKGEWIRDLGTHYFKMPLRATRDKHRFAVSRAPSHNISGRWATVFEKPADRKLQAVGEFMQSNDRLTGTFILPSGDYRYLEGAVTGDTLRLSTFDGNHAFLFEAIIDNDSTIRDGRFYSGNGVVEYWSARRNDKVAPDNRSVTQMREGESRLDFSFKSTSGQQVSINDPVYRGKVVLVQIMGSWCPNCMDETRFLSDYYSKNRNSGFEVIALAYERTTDFQTSVKALSRFQQQFNIQYPILITGVTVSDSLKTQKTLPQLTEIRHFPTLIYIDKKGMVRKIQTGFRGPGSGIHHQHFIEAFESSLQQLLAE